MAKAMLDSWKLVTIAMWVDQLDRDGALKLICDTWDWDELWEAAAELNQQFAERQIEKKIPRNQDRGEMKDRVKILGTAVIEALHELKGLAEPPVFVVTSTSLTMVPGVVKNNIQAEPAVTARLDNIEKMMEMLSKGFNEMKNDQKNQWPVLQVNGTPVDGATGGTKQAAVHHGQGGSQAYGGARIRIEQATLPVGGQGLRSRSDSRKRKAEEELNLQQQQQQTQGGVQGQGQQGPGWNQVVAGRGRRIPVQYGTSNVKVAGGEAAPYDVFVGNTHPDTTDDIVKKVLVQVSEKMSEEMKLEEPLEILEVECLTKPRNDGSKIWTRNWRVRVSNRFRAHMLRPEAYPVGWSSRRYFPARAARTPAAPLDPMQQQPPAPKRPNFGQSQDGLPTST